MSKHVMVPKEFQVTPFFLGEATYDVPQSFEEALHTVCFLYDMAAYNLNIYKPWKDIETAIPLVYKGWKEQKTELSSLFRLRKRNEAKIPMVLYTGHLISSLYWMNRGPVATLHDLTTELATLSYKPVNIQERIGFILEQPDHYHSFIQLAELYEEAEKLFFKAMAMKKSIPSK
ncbi:YpoC family protein [Bacillus sp. 165]|uniref:YpoC family protein n=1 Tax=Bacillus sp. 165 TaxID=1529117 RepID=UPI001AD999F2|nr:GTPase [Bacillus sp. 165]MBO9128209.1 GTPase [Bacillus sp. 165]